MQINESNLNFKPLTQRVKTGHILLHHCAGDGSVHSLHLQHRKQGWAGIGYHYLVRKSGEIWRGRPQWAQGSHCPGRNIDSIGICFEGNFEGGKLNGEVVPPETMSEIQLQAGLELVKYLSKQVYPGAKVGGHKDHYATACPGKNFPLERFKQL